jgi:hypothetical protein
MVAAFLDRTTLGEDLMNRTIAVGVMVVLGALLGCNKSDSSGSGGSGSTSTTSAGGGGGSIGVKECDDYIAKWNSCYKNPTVKAAAQPAFDQVKANWTQMAKDPNQKAALGTACKTMLDNFPSAACQ